MAYWIIRQNPHGDTDQQEMKNMILDTGIVTCPFGHMGDYRNNVIDGFYNNDSKGQDKTFVQKMKVGDTVLIVFKKPVLPMLARISSDTIDAYNTGYYTWKHDEVRHISRERADARVADVDVCFKPVCKRIDILKQEVPVQTSWRIFGQGSLSRMSDEVKQIL